MSSFIIMYPFGLIFFLLCFLMHACMCNASRLGLGSVAEAIDNNHAKDVNKLKLRDDQPSVSKQVETQESQDGVQGICVQENLMGANTTKQTLLNSPLKAKEDVSKAISLGCEIIISLGVDLHGMPKAEGSEKVTRSRSILGNSGGDTEQTQGIPAACCFGGTEG